MDTEDTVKEVHAGQFENVAKMSRLAPAERSEYKELDKIHVKTRPVNCNLENRTFLDNSTDHILNETKSATDDNVSPERSEKIFYKSPFTGEPSIDNASEKEKWRNKQRQREMRRSAQEEFEEASKENRRRRVLTRRQRNELHRSNYPGELISDVHSDLEGRYPLPSGNRSGYSTPGGSVDDRRLGRNMRAAPRHSAIPKQKTCSDKDLIEMLNKQQHLILKQREERMKYVEEQRIKQKAQQYVNETLLAKEMQAPQGDSPKAKMKYLLDNSFMLTANKQIYSRQGNESGRNSRQSDVGSASNVITSKPEDRSGSLTPTSAVADDEGRVADESTQQDDFFSDKKPVEKQEEEVTEKEETEEKKYMQAVHDEMQRLKVIS